MSMDAKRFSRRSMDAASRGSAALATLIEDDSSSWRGAANDRTLRSARPRTFEETMMTICIEDVVHYNMGCNMINLQV